MPTPPQGPSLAAVFRRAHVLLAVLGAATMTAGCSLTWRPRPKAGGWQSMVGYCEEWPAAATGRRVAVGLDIRVDPLWGGFGCGLSDLRTVEPSTAYAPAAGARDWRPGPGPNVGTGVHTFRCPQVLFPLAIQWESPDKTRLAGWFLRRLPAHEPQAWFVEHRSAGLGFVYSRYQRALDLGWGSRSLGRYSLGGGRSASGFLTYRSDDPGASNLSLITMNPTGSPERR